MFAKKLALAGITAAIAAVGVTGVAEGAVAGDTCQVNPNPNGWTIVTSWWGTSGGYKVYYPNSVTVTYDWTPSGWVQYSGYATGVPGAPTGNFTKDAVNESTCHH
jgi:hypothetical protein